MPASQSQPVVDELEEGHGVSRSRPLVLCYDGSRDARRAIRQAGALFPGGHALVLTVWQAMSSWASVTWSGATVIENFAELDRTAAEHGEERAEEGANLAREEGLAAEPLAVRSDGPIWESIVEIADQRDASVIVVGSRGLTGLRSILLGSVSGTVVHHAHRPTLVVHDPGND